MKSEQRLDYLIQAYQEGSITTEENKELNSWFDSYIDQDLEYPDEEGVVQSRMFVRLMEANGYMDKMKRHKRFVLWYRIAATVTLFFMAGLATFFYFSNPNHNIPKNRIAINGKIDVTPGGNAAQLILEDGSVMSLDPKFDEIKMGERIIYSDGSSPKDLSYQNQKGNSGILTLKTPKSGQYSIQLSDGTIVWMNAGSTLTYPRIFDNNKREVTLEGEAFFEVSRDPEKPFIIKTDKQSIKVLGTSFNVDNYKNRSQVRTTILSGEVKISTDYGYEILHSGQQITVSSKGNIVKKVYPQDAIAWKEGRFLFDNERLEDVMDKIGVWYDIHIEFSHSELKEERIFATGNRQENLSMVLDKIEATGVANFTIEKEKILITRHHTNK